MFGSRDRAHNVTIDGIDANESTVPNPQSNLQRLQPDDVQEFRTVTLDATAEAGRNSGANVEVATKAGANSVHGTAFYFNRNTDFNANEWFNNASHIAPPQLKLHQYGGDIGGPIIKNKTFFFFSIQPNLITLSQPISAAFGSTPRVYTSSMRNGIFRFVRGTVTANGKSYSQNSPALVDAGGNLLPGIATCNAGNKFQNCVDSYNIFANDPAGIGGNAATMGLINSEPLPNNFAAAGDGLNTGGYSWNPPSKFTGPQIMFRLDHNFGPNDNVFARWLQNSYNTTEGDFTNDRAMVFPGYPPLGEADRIGRNHGGELPAHLLAHLSQRTDHGVQSLCLRLHVRRIEPGFRQSSQASTVVGSMPLRFFCQHHQPLLHFAAHRARGHDSAAGR